MFAQSEKSIHVFVSGKVQGVFYRKSTQTEALRLGLVGWVRNLQDGRVECLMIGLEDKLVDALNWMGKGPARARVEQVDVRWGDGAIRETLTDQSTFVIEETR